jgi:hypothetical protein
MYIDDKNEETGGFIEESAPWIQITDDQSKRLFHHG